jgi:hypothetical protein
LSLPLGVSKTSETWSNCARRGLMVVALML